MVLKYLIYVVCMYLSISVYIKTGQVRHQVGTLSSPIKDGWEMIYVYIYIYTYVYIYDMIIYVKIGWK